MLASQRVAGATGRRPWRAGRPPSRPATGGRPRGPPERAGGRRAGSRSSRDFPRVFLVDPRVRPRLPDLGPSAAISFASLSLPASYLGHLGRQHPPDRLVLDRVDGGRDDTDQDVSRRAFGRGRVRGEGDHFRRRPRLLQDDGLHGGRRRRGGHGRACDGRECRGALRGEKGRMGSASGAGKPARASGAGKPAREAKKPKRCLLVSSRALPGGPGRAGSRPPSPRAVLHTPHNSHRHYHPTTTTLF